MKLRHKETETICSGNSFNMSSLSEIVVYYPDDCDSDYMRNYDCWLEQKQEWKDLLEAFRDKDVINDNYNTSFFEPPTKADRERGFTLY